MFFHTFYSPSESAVSRGRAARFQSIEVIEVIDSNHDKGQPKFTGSQWSQVSIDQPLQRQQGRLAGRIQLRVKREREHPLAVFGRWSVRLLPRLERRGYSRRRVSR